MTGQSPKAVAKVITSSPGSVRSLISQKSVSPENVTAKTRVKRPDGVRLTMDLQMITPTAIDWDKDGDFDLICGDEDGRVAFIENTGKLAGTHAELSDRFNMSVAEFAGFIDGINTSLKKEINLEKVGVDSALKFEIDFEKLYFNMHKAKANWLYTLKEWEPILTEEKRKDIAKEYRQSNIFVREEKVGRNDPVCSCLFKKVCYQFRCDRFPRSCFSVLPGVAKIGHDKVYTIYRCSSQSIYYDKKLHQVLVGRFTSRLHNIYVGSPDTFFYRNAYLTVRKPEQFRR